MYNCRVLGGLLSTRGHETVYLSSKISDAIMQGERRSDAFWDRGKPEGTKRERPNNAEGRRNRECITVARISLPINGPRATNAGPPAIKMHRVKLLTVQWNEEQQLKDRCPKLRAVNGENTWCQFLERWFFLLSRRVQRIRELEFVSSKLGSEYARSSHFSFNHHGSKTRTF